MGIKVKPSSYGPATAHLDENGVIRFCLNDSELTATPSLDSPAVTLLYSIASCMVLSLQMVSKRKKIEIQPFSFEVTAHKGSELPARFAHYDIVLSRNVHEDQEVAKKLLKDAKSICTISNSVSGTFKLCLEGEE
ncbi:OsmC family protein [Zobellella maritima]|uniref:OsmC family protein n=1 Tax=Zobellella maritima TaxID=2059725 RepID=UPI000E305685|nr:OsmC family protein [Zobellella maritima]